MKQFIVCCLFSVAGFAAISQVDIVWEKHYGGAASEFGYSVEITPDGGYVAAGYANSIDGLVEGNQGGNDFWVIKTDANGVLQWQNDLGGLYNDICFGITNAQDGGYMLLGTSESNNGDVVGNHMSSLPDMWLVKLDVNGDMLWSRCYGGSGYDHGRAIITTSDGGYAVIGQAGSDDGDLDGFSPMNDMWLLKLNASGDIIWQSSFGGASGETAWAVVEADDGGFMVANASTSWDSGDVTGNHGASDFWITRLNSTGALVWQKSLGSTGADIPKGIVKTNNNEYVICGSSGNNDGDVIGFNGTYDYWVVRINDDGDVIWQNSVGGYNDDKAASICTTADGGFVVTGFAMSDDGDATLNHGGHDVWVVKLNSAGELLWEKSFGGASDDDGSCVREVSPHEYVLVGQTSSINGDALSPYYGSSDFWMVRFTESSDGVESTLPQTHVQFAPNPFSNATYCVLPDAICKNDDARIALSDAQGHIVYTKKITSKTLSLDAAGLSSGIYHYRIFSAEKCIATGKLCIEK